MGYNLAMHPVQSKEWGEFRAKAGNKISWVQDLLVVWSRMVFWNAFEIQNAETGRYKEIKRRSD
ncbi:MAG: hypothetical protein UX99_C0002G0043 [Candidatus Amesbacteria bacterium GW2011_GWB1_47_26]|nr:MAG: hypothetical protein UX99_C0002G0043 [Candidatus Amesbacteria bacterium GW2011_GWB1_47_26]